MVLSVKIIYVYALEGVPKLVYKYIYSLQCVSKKHSFRDSVFGIKLFN